MEILGARFSCLPAVLQASRASISAAGFPTASQRQERGHRHKGREHHGRLPELQLHFRKRTRRRRPGGVGGRERVARVCVVLPLGGALTRHARRDTPLPFPPPTKKTIPQRGPAPASLLARAHPTRRARVRRVLGRPGLECDAARVHCKPYGRHGACGRPGARAFCEWEMIAFRRVGGGLGRNGRARPPPSSLGPGTTPRRRTQPRAGTSPGPPPSQVLIKKSSGK